MIGPDHTATVVVIRGIVIAPAVEPAVMVEAGAMMPTAAMPASMPAASTVEAAHMHAAAAETTAMETTAMEAVASATVEATAMTSTAAMASTKTHVRYEAAGGGFRRRQRTRTDR